MKSILNKAIVHKYTGVVMLETELYSLKLKDNLLIARAKNTTPNMKNLKDSCDVIKSIIHGNKIEFYLDNSQGIVLNKEQREFLNQELGHAIIQMAIKNSGWMAKLMVRFMKSYDNAPFVLKLVDSDEQAFKWLGNKSELMLN